MSCRQVYQKLPSNISVYSQWPLVTEKTIFAIKLDLTLTYIIPSDKTASNLIDPGQGCIM